MALSPSHNEVYYAEIIISARETTEVTITKNSTSEIVTVYENWSLHYDVDYNMRTTTDIEEKGIRQSYCHFLYDLIVQPCFFLYQIEVKL